MKPSLTLDGKLLENYEQFQGPFFERFKLHRAEKPLPLADNVEKDYFFPTLYGDVTCAMALFFCDYDAAQKALPHPKLKPVSMGRNRAAVVFSSYQYKQVLGMAPYNEIAVVIPVLVESPLNVPVLPMLIPRYPGSGFYVVSMPVTSLENNIRGHKLWGLPKVICEIECTEKEGLYITVCKTPAGEVDFRFEVSSSGTAVDVDQSMNLYSFLNGQLVRSTTQSFGSFFIKKRRRIDKEVSRSVIQFGSSELGDKLKMLNVNPLPFQMRFGTGISSCFELPDPEYRSDIYL